MDNEIKARADALADDGEIEQLYELIKADIEREDPYALYLYSGFSLDSANESDAQFSARYLRMQLQASEGGIAEASHQMAVNYLYGDGVEQSYAKATKFFERAIKQGHSHTKYTFGFSLYYGTDENKQDKARGLALMQEAANEGIEGAAEELALIKG